MFWRKLPPSSGQKSARRWMSSFLLSTTLHDAIYHKKSTSKVWTQHTLQQHLVFFLWAWGKCFILISSVMKSCLPSWWQYHLALFDNTSHISISIYGADKHAYYIVQTYTHTHTHTHTHKHKPEFPVLQLNHLLQMNQLQQLEILHPQRLPDAAPEKSCHFELNPVRRILANFYTWNRHK
jgi:hypothetical protein